MGDSNYQLGISAGVGCGLGILWGIANGGIRFQKGRDYLNASLACAGNAASSAGIYAITDHYTQDPNLPLRATQAYWGIQGVSNSLVFAGDRLDLNSNTAFNSLSLTANFLTTPLLSSAGLAYGLGGSIADGFESSVQLHGGMLGFDYESCPLTPFNLGIASHCTKKEGTFKHERGHLKQLLIMGDLGYGAILTLDYTVQSLMTLILLNPMPFMVGPGGFTTEPWAQKMEHPVKDRNHQ